jgi:acylphosphatase
MARHAVRLRIEGQVQGVGYRMWVVQMARSLGVDGWVRNRGDGSVEVLAIGEPPAVGDLGSACGVGPRGARVSAVTPSTAQDDGSVGFDQRATV